MQKTHIREKLKELGYPVEALSLGEFDEIGEHTAKKIRGPESELYKAAGAFYRPNYERGLFIYALIRSQKLTSFFEIGFGRGYGCLSAAKAFHDSGIKGDIITLDLQFDEAHLNRLYEIYPKEWFEMINFLQGSSHELLPQIKDRFDLIYIDGDHSYQGTKSDWEWSRDHANKFVLFDEYHLDARTGDECALAINEITGFKKELLIMDRRIFVDDRRYPDEQINYGQVLLTL